MSDAVLDDPGFLAARERFWTAALTDERYRENRAAVAERDGELIGIAMSGPPLDAAAAWMRQLYVLYVYAADHGTGAGRALLEAVIDPAESAALWVADPNPRAHAFYRKHGFVADGTAQVEGGVRENSHGPTRAAQSVVQLGVGRRRHAGPRHRGRPTACDVAARLRCMTLHRGEEEVGVRALHDRLSEHLDRVEQGVEIVVTRRGRRVARLSAIGRDEALTELVRRGLVRLPERPRTRRRASVAARGSVSELVAEQRR
jgi:prevent-host-death family protein